MVKMSPPHLRISLNCVPPSSLVPLWGRQFVPEMLSCHPHPICIEKKKNLGTCPSHNFAIAHGVELLNLQIYLHMLGTPYTAIFFTNGLCRVYCIHPRVPRMGPEI